MSDTVARWRIFYDVMAADKGRHEDIYLTVDRIPQPGESVRLGDGRDFIVYHVHHWNPPDEGEGHARVVLYEPAFYRRYVGTPVPLRWRGRCRV